MTAPLVTVLTAVRNGSRYLSEMIASIRRQTVADWEHIIVDDCSEDDSPKVVEEAAKADPRLRLVLRTVQSGPYVAANDGLGVARGKYVARIDADDLAPPERLEVQLRFLADHPEFRACGGFHQMMSGSQVVPRVSRTTTRPGVLRWRLSAAGGPTHSTAFVERAAFDELGGYAPFPLAQDLRMWCQLAQRNWLGVVPHVVAYRRSHSESIGRQATSLQFRLALEAARDHLETISGEQWPIDDVRTLWDVVRRDPSSFPKGLRILDRWAVLWRTDGQLSNEEKVELEAWTNRRRRLLAARSVREHPIAARVIVLETKVRDVRRRISARVRAP